MTAADNAAVRVLANRYELRDELGRGGMGVVWRARDMALDREVAIKEVRFSEDLDPKRRAEAHARVRREARSAARLSDEPGVVTVYDVLDVDGHPWVAMQLVSGQTLHEERRRGPLPVARVADVADALLRALRAAHAAGVVHRDIKPGNVMLADDGRVLLTDFGIATIDGETAVTTTGALVGSAEYIAPERLRETGPAKPRSDLWSLGATLYAALDGSSPFQRDSVAVTLAAVMADEPVPPPRHGGYLTPLVTGLLQRDPARRLTADQALDLLDGLRASVAPQAPPDVTTPAVGPAGAGRRWRWPLAVAGAVVATLLAVGSGIGWWLSRPVSTDYELYSDEDFSVRYPAGWEVRPQTEERPAAMSHPDESLGLEMTAGVYPVEGDALDEIVEHSSPQTYHEHYAWYPLDPARIGAWPDDWDVAAVESTHTVDEDQLVEEPWDDPERFVVWLQIHLSVDGNTEWAYWVGWAGPQTERDRYAPVITETLESFRPGR